MPKIIENLKERLRAEAFRQIEESGYSAMTIQSVAKKCGVGVGTVYNYYPSKDTMLLDYLLQHWENSLEPIRTVSHYSRSYDPVIRCIYDQLTAFNDFRAALAQDESAAGNLDAVMLRILTQISADISQAIRKFCRDDVESEIIAEALLIWAQTGKNYEDICNKIEKLF